MAVSAWKNITVLRGIAMLFVVLNHSSQLSGGLLTFQMDTFSPFVYPLEFSIISIIRSLSPVCLPAFLFASGFILHRMFQNWKLSAKAAFNVLTKYLFWAIPLLLLLSIKTGEFNLSSFITTLLEGGPMPSYWFLVLISALYLMSPFWVHLSNKKPITTLCIISIIQILVFLKYYNNITYELPTVVESFIIEPFFFLPPFVLGILFSGRVDEVLDILKINRPIIIAFLFITLALCLVESSIISYQSEWNFKSDINCFATERLSLFLFFLSSTIFFVSIESKKTKLRSWLSKYGVSSLGILLLFDICLKIATYSLWHIPDWILHIPETKFTEGIPPIWLHEQAITVLPIYIIVGVFGPLYIMQFTKKIIGKKSQVLW